MNPTNCFGDDSDPTAIPLSPGEPDVSSLLAKIGAELSQAQSEVDAAITTYMDSVRDQLSMARIGVDQSIDTYIGQVATSLDDARTRIDTTLQRQIKGISKVLNSAEDAIAVHGVQYPFSTAERSELMSDDSGGKIVSLLMPHVSTSVNTTRQVVAKVPPVATDGNPLPAPEPVPVGNPPTCIDPCTGNDIQYDPVNMIGTNFTGLCVWGPKTIDGALYCYDRTLGQNVRIDNDNVLLGSNGMCVYKSTGYASPCPGPGTVPPTPPPVVPPGQPPPVPPAIPPPTPLPVPAPAPGPGGGQCCPVMPTVVNVPPPVVVVMPTPPSTINVPPPVVVVEPPRPVPPVIPPPAPTPPPASPTAGVSEPRPVAVTQWDQPTACDTITRFEKSSSSIQAQDVPPVATQQTVFGYSLGSVAAPILGGVFLGPAGLAGGLIYAATDDTKTETKNQSARDSAKTQAGNNLWHQVITDIKPDGLRDPALAAAMGVKIAIARKAEEYGGFPAEYLTQWERYNYQHANPMMIPDQAGIDTMYLRDKISSDDWVCYTRANGNIPYLYDKQLRANAVVPNVFETVQLHLRDKIPTADEFVKRLRQIGVLQESNAMEFLELAKQIPGPADLIRMMVRDSADDNVARDYQYDKDFTSKFAGKIKDWARNQGMDDSIFLYLWRAHWQIPSNTQLYEMLHRLRVDRKEFQDWLALYGPGAPKENDPDAPPRPHTITKTDVQNALEVNDNAPFFVPMLMDISYHPINTSDAVRAYQHGLMEEYELVGVYQDNGYNKQTAERLRVINRSLKIQGITTQTSTLNARQILSYYKDGAVGRDTAKNLLAEILPDEKAVNDILDRAEVQVNVENTACSLRRLKKRFIYGYYSITELKLRLALTVPNGVSVNAIAERWECDRDNRLKEPRVGVLCGWFTNGFIDAKEYVRRLMNLGYTEEDAYKIGGVCYNNELVKRIKQARAAAEANYKELQKDYRLSVQERRQELADAQKRIDELRKAYTDQLKEYSLLEKIQKG